MALSNNTNDLQQSRFLPLLQQAENTIKKLVTKYLLELKSPYELRYIINTYIADFDKNKLPRDIANRQSYINGLYLMANKVQRELEKQRLEFAIVLSMLVKVGVPAKQIATPKLLNNYIVKNPEKIKYDMWSQAKASVRVKDYPNKIKEYIKRASEIPTLAVDGSKKPITIWQKAELDIRHEHQLKMVEEAKDSGEDLWWISSHPDCSKRCQKWQGKLVSVSKKATMSGFRVGKVDGHWVYSLPDITAQVDKYGYTNNIIVGFNCRHKLLKYESGKLPPKEYSAVDVKKEREINDTIRRKEREIRLMRTQIVMGNKKLLPKMKKAIADLRAYCDKMGFTFNEYRIK